MLVFMCSTRFSGQILMKLEFVDRFFEKNTQISNFMTILPAGSGLFREDGQTDKTELIVTLRNFANAPK
jgi:hypothetical protein